MPKIIFLHDGETIEFEYSKKSLLYNIFTQSGSSHNFQYLRFPCGGKGTCRKCKIKVTDGTGDKSKNESISTLTDAEKKYLTTDEIKNGIRFACMCEVWGDVTVSLPDESGIGGGKMIIQTDGMKSDTLAVRKDDTSGGYGEDVFGTAVDIGTTTVAVYLCRLDSGEIIDIGASENPQRVYGADVISRINYVIENKEGQRGLNILKSAILTTVFRIISELCSKNGTEQKNIRRIVLAGNTVMQHLAAGISPESIAFAPFTAPTLFGYETTLGELLAGTDIKKSASVSVDTDAKIYFPPAFASYVGGDISAGIIAADTDMTEKTRLFLDIGTNGEIGFGGKDGLIFCAAAAGPAFEGANIKLGLPGIEGAINKVYIDGDSNIAYSVISGGKPTGICGSGIIDAVAVMLETGVIDETGRIAEGAGTYEIDGEKVFYIDKAFNIYITQKDIREIQLAKSAVCAGIMTLLHYSGKTTEDIDEVILAGGFGSSINKRSACRIGLIPAELEAKIKVAGNTAGMGAVAALTDSDAVSRMNKVKAMSKYIELSGDSFFMDEYIERMAFET